MRKINIYFSILLLIFLSVSSIFPQKPLSETAERLKSHVSFLASDELEGRFTGTPGNEKAADYIMNYFKNSGLLAEGNSYYKYFPFTSGLIMKPDSKVLFNVLMEKPGLPKEMWKPVVRNWNAGTDWMPHGISDNGNITGELVFAGFGITAKEINYDDYAGIDANGKVVIVLVDSSETDPKQERFAAYSTRIYKASNARDHGAKAIIFVKTQSDSANIFIPLKVERMSGMMGIVAIQANRTSIAAFFPKNFNLYPVELEMYKTGLPKSFHIPYTTVNINVNLDKEIKNVPNVIGMVKGTDAELSKEFIVVGAHFDHLGWGQEKSNYKGKVKQIHNGADDNASGVSGLLELASRIAKNPLKRTVIFVAFNGEENGLLGSSAFIQNLPVPVQNIITMINLDMIGRLKENKLNVFGTNSSDIFSSIVDSLSLVDSIGVNKASESYAPSDHAKFLSEGIPILFLFTGVHMDYHMPTDDAEKINYEGLAKVTKFAESLLNTIGNTHKKPLFRKSSLNDQAPPSTPDKGYPGVWFGIVPGFEDNPDGFKIDGTQPGSPAEKAGLLKGDIIIQFGSKITKSLHDLTFAMKEHKPGDKVIVKFIRSSKENSVNVILGKR